MSTSDPVDRGVARTAGNEALPAPPTERCVKDGVEEESEGGRLLDGDAAAGGEKEAWEAKEDGEATE